MQRFHVRLVLAVALAATLAAGARASFAAGDDALYRAFGQRDGLVKIVADATNRWVADDRIKDTFDNINLERFKNLLVDQLCELTGGPCKYTGRNMYEAHKGLHLNQAEFNALVEDLQLAMNKYDIPFSTQNELLVMLAPMEHDSVTR